MGIPTVLHEQNAVLGRANRFLASDAAAIATAYNEVLRIKRRFGDKTVMVGNPVRDAIAKLGEAPFPPFDEYAPFKILVTGGSQGALAVNRAVAEWLNAGHPGAGGIDAQIIWTTGRGTYEQFKAYHRPPAVQVFEFLDPMSYAYAVADLAISRAGMMTLAELCAWGIPSILIPLPTAAADHQTPNARVLSDAGAAIHLPQRDLTPARLQELLVGLLSDPVRLRTMAAAALARGQPDAASRIVDRIGVLSG
jgi:UDP-N-acetylglucosamine--N-acetylmuramyl-(pentapeptide) pyrophosphoryl-undecaprenol N-acetylglucosamine transferase